MNKERLLRLADFLDNEVPIAHFDMSSWFDVGGRPRHLAKLGECGTSACAFGWATQIPEFQEQGLRLSSLNGVTFNQLDGYDAAEAFFDIKRAASAYLFSASDHRNEKPADVARRIRGFVERGEEFDE